MAIVINPDCSTEELFFMEKEFNGPPYGAGGDGASSPESPYQKYTPSAKAHLWKTPTLVIHGAKGKCMQPTAPIAISHLFLSFFLSLATPTQLIF